MDRHIPPRVRVTTRSCMPWRSLAAARQGEGDDGPASADHAAICASAARVIRIGQLPPQHRVGTARRPLGIRQQLRSHSECDCPEWGCGRIPARSSRADTRTALAALADRRSGACCHLCGNGIRSWGPPGILKAAESPVRPRKRVTCSRPLVQSLPVTMRVRMSPGRALQTLTVTGSEFGEQATTRSQP